MNMSSANMLVTTVALPAESAIAHVYPSVNLADAYAIPLPEGATTDPELLARFIFAQQAPWVGHLLKLRDVMVAGFGLKTTDQLASLGASAKSSRVGIFKIYSRSANEIVLGEDDSHLDFRVSLLSYAQPAPPDQRRIVMSTVVHCHNRLGRFYIFVIAPFHRVIVQSSLRRAAQAGWPQAESIG